MCSSGLHILNVGPPGSALKGGGLDKLYIHLGKEGGESERLPLPCPLPLPRLLLLSLSPAGEVVEPGDGLLLRPLPLPCPLPLAANEVTGLQDLAKEGEGGE